mmetsp:Transcript_2357/g.5579  ORF Transcript_2357/g.5579 Transcript_2357/m.5579 type:complete len:279 (+) Transcript_2357:89-925(+)|eukprot:CAMPEP_0114548454 /NCGR_PEP_ID=MMETSP0114-20121206/4988_1 /TAXON_ID=31324 /ORGANISM="Goniomonas sp, Strain m" /LENGTH=278 /DNA_ID=CAMNT_0001733041 /DNA_START=85 /DNA_END=918 /DNA_ORIENTATION=+
MSSAETTVAAIYSEIIKEVVAHSMQQFREQGQDENQLVHLQQLWEAKLQASGAVGTAFAASSQPAYHPPAQSVQQPILGPLDFQMPGMLPDSSASGWGRPPASLGDSSVFDNQGAVFGNFDKFGDGGIPQHDGGADELERNAQRRDIDADLERRLLASASGSGRISQVDGGDDDSDLLRPAKQSRGEGGAHFPLGDDLGEGVDEEEPLGDQDDDVSEASLGPDLDDVASVPEPANLVLTQFEKVSRTKNNWKCMLKDGVVQVGGRDYLFKKASGQFEW